MFKITGQNRSKMKKKFFGILKQWQWIWRLAHAVLSLLPLSFLKRTPSVIKFEATNYCNLRCPVCPTSFSFTRERGFMSMDLFRKVIDELQFSRMKPHIVFSMSGEPLLNKDLPEFIHYANKREHTTCISTNCTMLNSEVARRLIERGLSTIRLAVDGSSKMSHEAYRIGSDFFEVKRNIEGFLRVKKSLNSDTPFVVIQTLLTSFSESEIESIIIWAKNIGADRVTFKSLSMGSYTSPEKKRQYEYLLPRSNSLLRRKTSLKRTVCRRPLKEAVIFWEGTFGLCCVDFNGTLHLPNIKQEGFIPLWRSQKLLKIRRMGVLRNHALCRNCSLGKADWGGFSVDLNGAAP